MAFYLMKFSKIYKNKHIDKLFTRTILIIFHSLTKLLYSTLKVKTNEETLKIFKDKSSLAMFCWHESFSMLPYVNVYYRKNDPITGLVSNSKDGDYLSYFLSRFKISTERGSSSRNGGRSAINLIRLLRNGGNICITPDGPKGPRRKAKDGMLAICAKSPNSRIVFVNIAFENSWKFKSWDKFSIPKPFSTILINSQQFDGIESLKEYAKSKGLSEIIVCENLLNSVLVKK